MIEPRDDLNQFWLALDRTYLPVSAIIQMPERTPKVSFSCVKAKK